jgi:hypothetical protein
VAARPQGAGGPAVSIGSNLRALTVYLVVFQHVPAERCARLIADVTGAEVSAGFVHACLARAAEVIADVVRLIKTLITAAHVAGFDETTLRCGPAGQKKYVLAAVTERYSLFFPGRRTLESFRDRQDDVLRFTRDTRVWPTNNISERGVRPLKTQQKISGRLTSEKATQDWLDPQLHRHRPQARLQRHRRPAQRHDRQPMAPTHPGTHLNNQRRPPSVNEVNAYLFPYTRKSFSPATGLYSPSCRAFIPFSHASFFDEVWNVVSPTNLL